MKKYGLLISILFPCLSFGQLTMAVQAGANYATPHLSKQTEFNDMKGNFGWQAGVYTAYQKHKLFVYSGLNLVQYHFSEGGGNLVYNSFTYHPIYLQLPLGVGYKLPFHKTKSITLYGGAQGLLGIAGKLQEPHYIECITYPCPQPTDRYTSNIKFGRNASDYSFESFSKTAVNLQAGATVTLTNSITAGVSYAWGITDLQGLSNDYTGITHLRIWDVSVKYSLIH